MGVRLAKDRDDFDKVRTEPKPLSEFKPASLKQDYDNHDDEYDSESGSDSDEKQASNDDGWNQVSDDRQTKRTQKRNQEKADHFAKKQMQRNFEEEFPAIDEAVKDMEPLEPLEEDKNEAKPTVEPVSENADIDDERTGGEWVTAENLYKHISKGDAEALITTDSSEQTVQK